MSNSVREEVSKAYAKAIKSSGCQSGQCDVRDPAGMVAGWAGYSKEDLAVLAEGETFGCGNPLAFFEVEKGQVVLDLGSGAGLDLLIAGARVGPEGQVIGVDMTDEMLAVARANVEKSGLDNVELKKGIIEELPVDSGSVDWVISNCVINLSPEKERVFQEIVRVLKPGGQISVSDLVVTDLPAEVRSIPALYNSCIGGAISEEEYLRGLSEAGLEDVSVVDRKVYDAAQLIGLAESMEGSLLTCCGGDASVITPEVAQQLATSLEGKVWSAQFKARKPIGEK